MRKIAKLTVAVLAFACVCGSAAAQPGPALSSGEFERMLEFGRTLAAQDKHADACVKFGQVLASGSEIERYYKDAEYELAVGLLKLGFYQSAYSYLERIADAGEAHPHYTGALRWLLELHRAVPGDMSPLEKMSLYPPESFPKDISDELSFLVGQFYYYDGDLDASLKMLARVTSENESFFLKARYLQGVVHVRKNDAKPALEAFKDILRYVRDSGSDSDEATRFGEMATLSLARIFYSTGQYATAVRYYDRVDQFSPMWLDALFEVSWSYFQLENFGRALGNLHTLTSPYFEEEYFPETLVLQAVILYYNCKYDEALEVIDRFIKDYWQLKKELETQLSSYSDPNEFYGFLARLSRKGGSFSLRLKRIFNAALSDKKLSRLLGLVVHLNREIDGLNKLQAYAPAHDLAEALVGDVIAYRELVIGEAGELARSRLTRVHRELKDLLAQALKVKFEALNRKKRALVGGAGDKVVREAPEPIVDAEHLLWRFQGEYWRDELDSYLFKISSECPAEASAK